LEAAAGVAVAEDTGAGPGAEAGCAGTGVTVVSGTVGVGRSDPAAGAGAGDAGAGDAGWGAAVTDAEATADGVGAG